MTALIFFATTLFIPLLIRIGSKFWHKRQARAINRAYYRGYSWAMSSLHSGVDLNVLYPPFDPGPATTLPGAFDAGVAHAMRTFDEIDGDKMWERAKLKAVK